MCHDLLRLSLRSGDLFNKSSLLIVFLTWGTARGTPARPYPRANHKGTRSTRIPAAEPLASRSRGSKIHKVKISHPGGPPTDRTRRDTPLSLHSHSRANTSASSVGTRTRAILPKVKVNCEQYCLWSSLKKYKIPYIGLKS